MIHSTSIQTLLRHAYPRIHPFSETAILDAQVLLAHQVARTRSWIAAHPEALVTSSQAYSFEKALKKIEMGLPLPYILGKWEFYQLEFIVTPAVLIPRPETEHLVDHALHWLRTHPETQVAFDVGTGSGCIAISLAVHMTRLSLIGLDLSWDALQIAQENAVRHIVSKRISYIQGDLLSPIANRCNLICANLPYVPMSQITTDACAEMSEPKLALDGGVDGLETIRRFLNQATAHLESGGRIVMEIEAHQGDSVQELAKQNFPQAQIAIHADLAGHDRILTIDQP